MNKENTTAKEYVKTISPTELGIREALSKGQLSEKMTYLVMEAYANKRVTEALEEVEKLKELAKEMLKKDIAVAYMKGFIKAQEMFVNHIIKGTNENQIIEDINTHYLKESDAKAYADKIIKKSHWLNV